jgi:hypothetical protein
MEEEPEEPKRLRWPLLLAALFTPFALYTGEPTFTCLAFVGLLVGYIGYRLGTFALRTLAFPLGLLVTMIPVPGVLMDAVLKRAQPALLRLITNLLAAFGIEAEVTNDGNPIQIPPDPRPLVYALYAGQTGTGFAEAGLGLLLGACWLSLMQGTVGNKIRIWLITLVWVGFLIVARLVFLGILGSMIGSSLDGQDTIGLLAWATRWLLPVAGLAGQYFLMRAFHCREYQEWIAR